MAGGVIAQPRRLPLAHFAAYTVTVLLVLLALAELLYGWFGPPNWRANLGDLTIYTDATRRHLAGGSYYLPHQLAGPYTITWGDVLYPPTTMWWWAPWLVLPGWTFVVSAVAVTLWVIVKHRPAPWGWVLMGLCLAWPATTFKAVSANPGVWVMASVALGTLYGWPAAFALLKPTFAPFALFGWRTRKQTAIVLAALAVLTLPFIPETLDYPRVILNAGANLAYSAEDYPMVLIPVVAWLGRAKP